MCTACSNASRRLPRVAAANGESLKCPAVSLPRYGPRSQDAEALDLLDTRGSLPSRQALELLIQNVADSRDLAVGRQLYHLIVSQSPDFITDLGNDLIRMFAACESLEDAKLVFCNVGERKNVHLWCAIMSAHVALGKNKRALDLYEEMRRDGISPNSSSFVCLLKACGNIGSIEQGQLVHEHIRRCGLESDVVVGSALVHMYAKCGSLIEADKAFLCIRNRNVVSWGALISGYAQYGKEFAVLDVFNNLQQDRLFPNKVIFLCLLKACGHAEEIEQGRWIHDLIISIGLESDPAIGNSLVDMYSKCDDIYEAHSMFGVLSSRNVVSWNALLVGLVQHGHILAAFELFISMQNAEAVPSTVTYSSILKACGNSGASLQGTIIHHQIINDGARSDAGVQNSLIDMYCKSGSIRDAHKVFNDSPDHDLVSWGVIIAGYAQHGDGIFALELSVEMQQRCMIPNKVTILCTLKACGLIKAITHGKMVHVHLIAVGLESDAAIGSALIDMYAKCEKLQDAQEIFDQLLTLDAVAWGTMINGYVQHGHGLLALELFEQMCGKGVKADEVTLSSTLKACGSIGAMGYGKLIHEHIIVIGYEGNVAVGSCLVDMYSRCGNLEEAFQVFNMLPNRNAVTWCAMIAGYAHHGQFEPAVQCLEEMHKQGVKPEGDVYTGILAALGHSGEVLQGQTCLRSMREAHAITPRINHYNCMVDLLGRAGHFGDVEELLSNMPVSPDSTVWMSLLIACKKFGNVSLAEECFQQVLRYEPENATSYELMSHIYSNAGMMDKCKGLQVQRKDAGVWKKPAKAWIEASTKVHEFVVGDRTHSLREKIATKSRKLGFLMKKSGYVPELGTYFNRMTDREKEETLNEHCERLAIAFGLLTIPAGLAIRVTKNLRVCTDCHNASKYISKIEKREIIIRDAHRVHHFVDGSCSCEDYY